MRSTSVASDQGEERRTVSQVKAGLGSGRRYCDRQYSGDAGAESPPLLVPSQFVSRVSFADQESRDRRPAPNRVPNEISHLDFGVFDDGFAQESFREADVGIKPGVSAANSGRENQNNQIPQSGRRPHFLSIILRVSRARPEPAAGE